MREGDVQPYIEHPRRIVAAIRHAGGFSDVAQCAAWLHDVLEDTKVTYTDIHNAGFDYHVVDLVMRLTRRPNESYADYIVRLRTSRDRDAIQIKLFDLADNMSDLKDGARKDKYSLAMLVLTEALREIEGV